MKLDELYLLIKQRIKDLPPDSTVALYYKEGLDRILQKVGEESVETIIAAKGPSRKRCIEETADLLFMILVMLAAKEISLKEIEAELKRRRNNPYLAKIRKKETSAIRLY